MFAGMLLFLIGIASGLAVGLFQNPRLAVSGHLEGVLNGMFLLIVGLIWPRLALGDRARKIAFALVLFGTYANWALTMLGAAWGTKKLTPIAGAGYESAPWQETAMTVGLSVMVVAMAVGVGLLAWGLRRELTPPARA